MNVNANYHQNARKHINYSLSNLDLSLNYHDNSHFIELSHPQT